MNHPAGAYLPSIEERRQSVHAERLRNSLADWSAALAAVSDLPSAVRQDMVDALDLARRFNAEVVRPLALAIDARAGEDPAYVPAELVRQAGQWGLFTVWLPSLFGGKGWNFLSLYAFLEEVSSACVGIANVVGVHYMGVAMLTGSWNVRLAHRVCQDVCDGERRGVPRPISLAMNEPLAGSDLGETLLLARGTLGTQATARPDGGYVLSGHKTMISNGHVSAWHMVVAFEDLARPADTMVVLAVPGDAPGVRLGRLERKLGQRACVASEIFFEGCEVHASHVALDRRLAEGLGRGYRELSQTLLDYVVSCTRAGVGAFAAGTARGAYEAAREHAARKLLPGGRLIEQQWAQTALAEMHKNVTLARQAYLESALANGMGGLFRLMFYRPLYWADQLAPMPLWRVLTRFALRSPDAARYFQKRFLAAQPREWQNLVSGLASSAKVAGSELAMANVGLAMDLLGAEALRREFGIEKRLRDAKVLQIHEGSNPVNLVNLFKCRVRSDEGVPVFVPEKAGVDAAWPDLHMAWPDEGHDVWWTDADRFARAHAAAMQAGGHDARRQRAAWLDGMHGLGWASLCGERARGGQGQPVAVLCRVLEAVTAVNASAAAVVYASAAAHLALKLCEGTGERAALSALLRDLAVDWLCWPAFHDIDEPLWPSVDAQGYLRGQVGMLLGGSQASWAVLPAHVKDQGLGIVVVDLRHPAVIRSESLSMPGLGDGGVHDVEFGGVPCEVLSMRGREVFQALVSLLGPAVMAMQCGLSRACLHDAVQHARTRRQGGSTLMGWGEVRRMLAVMHERLRVMQSLLAASLPDARGRAGEVVLHVGDLACAQADDGVQVLGGIGCMTTHPAAMRLCDARQIKGLMGGAAWRRQWMAAPMPPGG